MEATTHNVKEKSEHSVPIAQYKLRGVLKEQSQFIAISVFENSALLDEQM